MKFLKGDGFVQCVYKHTRSRTIAGVPLEEARNVLTLYKYGIPCPNHDYYTGFRYGYQQCVKDQKDAFDKFIKEQFDGISGNKVVSPLWETPKD